MSTGSAIIREVRFVIDPDGERAVFTMELPDGSSTKVDVPAAQVRSLMRGLANVARVLPPEPPPTPGTQSITATVTAHNIGEAISAHIGGVDKPGRFVTFILESDVYGSIGFVLPPDGARMLGNDLLAWASRIERRGEPPASGTA